MKLKKLNKIFSIGVVTIFIYTGCENSTESEGPEPVNSGVYILQSDYTTGLLEWMSEDSNQISSANLVVNQDAAIKSYGKYIYILEKYGVDNVLKFDPSKTGMSAVLYQTKLGTNWNPVDMEFVSEKKAYIANQNEAKITVFDPTDNKVLTQIDISKYTFNPDSNKSPYASALQLVGSDLYVLLQRRDGYVPGISSLLLRISTTTHEVIDTISLQFKNGYDMAYANGSLIISNPGDPFSVDRGGIEKVDLATKEVTTILEESTLGGSPNEIIHKEGSRFYITNYIGWKNVQVLEIDISTKSIIAKLPSITDAFGGIYFDHDLKALYVGERDSIELGVKIFKDNVKTAGPIKSNKSLPPVGIVVIK